MKFRKRDIVKLTVEVVISSGVAIIVNGAISKVVPTDLSKTKQVLVKIGSVAIVGAVSSAVSLPVTRYIDVFVEGVEAGARAHKDTASAKEVFTNIIREAEKDAETPREVFENILKNTEASESTSVMLDIPEDPEV